MVIGRGNLPQIMDTFFFQLVTYFFNIIIIFFCISFFHYYNIKILNAWLNLFLLL